MIPSIGHFIWFGRDLPWIHGLAIRSAARVGRLERVILHHDSDLSKASCWRELIATPGFEARPIDAAAILAGANAEGLAHTYAALSAPAAKANVLRVALLASEGGVYLDLDTITVRPLDDLLLRPDFFCGEEQIAYPVTTMESRNPLVWARALALDGARDICRRIPRGYRAFLHIASAYAAAVNNAVIGAPRAHPFTRQLLRAMAEVPEERRGVRYELGTSLLQREVAAWQGVDGPRRGLLVYPPEVFYPLGPEISSHWFRLSGRVDVDEVVTPRTSIVHWYASVRTHQVASRVDARWVESHRDRELFSALVFRLGLA